MTDVMDHVRELADVIGPRPACTDAEATAADYIEGVFSARGLETERQEFDCPRTESWAHLVSHLLTAAAAVLALWLPWPALVLGVVGAVLLWLEMDSRFTIAPMLGKGPSQNVIARHVPRQRRGERLKRIVIVAHYDSAKPSLLYSPGMVRNLRLIATVTRVVSVLVPLVILVGALPFAASWTWIGYLGLAVAAYLLFPIVTLLQRELLSHATDGANDNASGVAAMLGVMERTVPESDESQRRTHYRDAETAYGAGVVPDDALLEYRSVGEQPVRDREPEDAPLGGFGDVDWETGRLEPVRTPEPAAPVEAPDGDWTQDAGVGPLWEDEQAPPTRTPEPWRGRPQTRQAPAPVPADWSGKPSTEPEDDDIAEGQESLPFDLPDARQPAEPADSAEHDGRHGHGISAWLGIGKGFDVRKAGKRIGSWENIDHDDDDDFGFKGGTAGEMPGDEAAFASDVAARIRRRVTENVDRALTEKEIWFVATGADEAGGWGTRHLLDAYGDDLEDALIINITAVGTGTISYVSEEGLLRNHHADRRLVAQSKRTARENEMTVKGRVLHGSATSATPALARRFKAMTVMAFDINGRVPNRRWHTDVIDNVLPGSVEQATEFVAALLRDL